MNLPVIPEAEAFAEAVRDLPHAFALRQIPAQRGALAPLGRDDGWKLLLSDITRDGQAGR